MKFGVFLWLALSAGLVWAQDPNVQRFEQTLVAAEEGDPSSQFALAQIYELGLGTEKSTSSAFAWYDKAAKRGHARAQLILGQTYYWGRYGQPKNLALAAEWFQRAAAKGNSQAKTQLATMYALGQGVPQDAQQAQTLRNEAANSTAQETEEDIQALAPRPDPAAQQAEAKRLKQEAAAVKATEQQAAKDTAQALAQQQAEAKQKADEQAKAEQTQKLAKVKTALLDTRWLGADKKPALHLPSEAVTCVDNASGLVCTSEAQDAQRGNTKFRYSVKSFLRDFTALGGFSVSYRNKVTEILQDSPETPIQLGWQSQTHEITCTRKAKQLVCLKSGSEQIYTAAP